jgi:hypothetical protein
LTFSYVRRSVDARCPHPLAPVIDLAVAAPSRDNLYLSYLARRGRHVRVNEHPCLIQIPCVFFSSLFLSCARSRFVLFARHSRSRNRCPERPLSIARSLSLLYPPFPYLRRLFQSRSRHLSYNGPKSGGYFHASSCDGLRVRLQYYVIMKSTHARPVLVDPHRALACGESWSWATDSNKSISVEK